MQITGIARREELGELRIEAKVLWEDTVKPPQTVFVATNTQFGGGFWPDANGFLIGCIFPAWHAGERRIKIDGGLCPVLTEHLKSALLTLQTWYPEMGIPPAIESTAGYRVLGSLGNGAASFLSCGIDSLATLRWNKLNLPADHPAAIKAALLVDFSDCKFMPEQEARNLKRVRAAAPICTDLAISAIPISTNLLALDGDGWFYSYKWHGAVLSALAHFFSRSFQRTYIASSDDAAHLAPWGSHPLLDACYSSAHLQIEHHGTSMTRLDKVKLVSNWQVGLQNILVCQGEESGDTNCGKCEKCICTMTALTALDKLQGCQSFPVQNVTPELLKTVQDYGMVSSKADAEYYRQLIRPLQKCGREDLAAVIQQLLGSFAQHKSQTDAMLRLIAQAIPAGKTFILIDKDQFGCAIEGERKGYYWGSPPRFTAVRELRNLRAAGANYLVIHRPGFWWLDYHYDLRDHLSHQGRRIVETDELIVFKLS